MPGASAGNEREPVPETRALSNQVRTGHDHCKRIGDHNGPPREHRSHRRGEQSHERHRHDETGDQREQHQRRPPGMPLRLARQRGDDDADDQRDREMQRVVEEYRHPVEWQREQEYARIAESSEYGFAEEVYGVQRVSRREDIEAAVEESDGGIADQSHDQPVAYGTVFGDHDAYLERRAGGA